MIVQPVCSLSHWTRGFCAAHLGPWHRSTQLLWKQQPPGKLGFTPGEAPRTGAPDPVSSALLPFGVDRSPQQNGVGWGGAGDMPVSCTQWRNLETDPVPGIFSAVRSPWRRAWRGGGRRFTGDLQALGLKSVTRATEPWPHTLGAAFRDPLVAEVRSHQAVWPSLIALTCVLISEVSRRLQPRRWRR